MLSSMDRMAARYFRHPRLRRLVSWPVLFLGAKSSDTPAMYSLMSYADLQLGTWYPRGGMHTVLVAMADVARSLGVDIRLGSEVRRIVTANGRVTGVETHDGVQSADGVVGTGDYHHIEQDLLPAHARTLTPAQWDRKVMSPSSLLFYVGMRGELELPHHTLFFDADMDAHLDAVYGAPVWPDVPLFYACTPSATDPTVAPPGHSNLFVLVPLAPGLQDSDAERERLWGSVMARLSAHAGHDVAERVVLRRDFGVRDFVEAYRAYKGNAYGMANTLLQTGPFRPPLRSRALGGMYFTGQLTVPGPGMPPSLVSGELAARVLLEDRGLEVTEARAGRREGGLVRG
jgi:phytoene desaturase